jgi:hypothetical protein
MASRIGRRFFSFPIPDHGDNAAAYFLISYGNWQSITAAGFFSHDVLGPLRAVTQGMFETRCLPWLFDHCFCASDSFQFTSPEVFTPAWKHAGRS